MPTYVGPKTISLYAERCHKSLKFCIFDTVKNFLRVGDKLSVLLAYCRAKMAYAQLYTTLLQGASKLCTNSNISTDMGRKLGGCTPFQGRGELGPHLTQCRLGRYLPPYQVASQSIQLFGHNTLTSQTLQTRTV